MFLPCPCSTQAPCLGPRPGLYQTSGLRRASLRRYSAALPIPRPMKPIIGMSCGEDGGHFRAQPLPRNPERTFQSSLPAPAPSPTPARVWHSLPSGREDLERPIPHFQPSSPSSHSERNPGGFKGHGAYCKDRPRARWRKIRSTWGTEQEATYWEIRGPPGKRES